MTRNESTHESRELKSVSAVIALLALPVYAFAFAFSRWDGQVISVIVGTGILGIAAGLRLYASRPGAFGSDSIGDRLRTQYHRPEPTPITPLPAEAPAAKATVWTPSYRRFVARQTLAVIAVLVLNISLAIGVTLFLAAAGGPMLLIAALLILAVFFMLGSEFAVISHTAYVPAPEAPRAPVVPIDHLTPAARTEASTTGGHAA